LLASALVSLVQTVASVSTDTTSPSWQALRGFIYSAIILNLSGAFLALMTIKMCSDLPVVAQQKLIDGLTTSNVPMSSIVEPDWITPEHDNIPFAATIAGKGVLSVKILGDHFLLLRCFGMSRWYKAVVRISSWVLVAACVCSFAALTLWMFLSESVTTAGLTMIPFGITAIIVICVFLVGGVIEQRLH
jgi:hypothetical protein